MMASEFFANEPQPVEPPPPPRAEPVHKKQRGCGFWVFCTVAVLVLFLGALVCLGLIGGMVLSSSIPGKPVRTESGSN